MIDKQKQLELEQIRIELKASDLYGFEFDAEIRILANEMAQKKAVVKSELDTLQQNLSILERSFSSIEQYSSSEKLTLTKAIDEYDRVNSQLTALSLIEYGNDRLEQQKGKIASSLKNIKSLVDRASESNVSLPPLSFSITSAIEKYNLYL